MSDQQLQQFMNLTNCTLQSAKKFLSESSGNLEEALNAYYAHSSEDTGMNEATGSQLNTEGSASGVQAGQSPGPRKSTSPLAKTKETPKFKSLTQIIKESQAIDDGDDEARHTFAGGETSGLEVTDPNDSNSLIRDLLDKARRGGERSNQDSEGASEAKKSFTGKGYRLGSSVDTQPEVVEEAGDSEPAKPKKVTREITFWKEGFQIGGDEPLYRYDDPANSYYLHELNQGRAPLRLLNVEFGQEVDVNVYKKLDESYKPPKRKYGGFEGSGRRLGSPIPGESLVERQPASKSETATPSPLTQMETTTEDSSTNTSVQIRYANGQREILRCNDTDKIQFLYDHVRNNTSDPRDFTLNHTCPIKPIDDLNSTVKEQELCNAVVVQRWI